MDNMSWVYNGKEYDYDKIKMPQGQGAGSALCSILWYEGWFDNKEDPEYQETYCDCLRKSLQKAIDDNKYILSYDDLDKELANRISNWNSEEHCIWMMFVGMFGSYGTSIRSGWIEREYFQDMIDFLDGCEISICGAGIIKEDTN